MEWAFYGDIPDLKPDEVYTAYEIWCALFDYEPMKKFEFIEVYKDMYL